MSLEKSRPAEYESGGQAWTKLDELSQIMGVDGKELIKNFEGLLEVIGAGPFSYCTPDDKIQEGVPPEDEQPDRIYVPAEWAKLVWIYAGSGSVVSVTRDSKGKISLNMPVLDEGPEDLLEDNAMS